MRTYETFEQVAARPRHVVVDLLRTGDAPVRVWAAWVLAMREGPTAVESLRGVFASDPDAGVRRHVLVTLVGLGVRDVLGVTASREPSAFVRAEATRYVARLAAPDDLGAYDLLLARALDIAWSVRATVAAELRTDAPAIAVQRVAGLLFDPDPDVRRVMCDRIEAGDFPREPVAEVLAVLERLKRRPLDPPDPRVRALVRILRPLD